MGHRSRKARPQQFTMVPNQTVDHFEKRSPVALGLLTINLRHADGFPITLTRVQDNAQHGSKKSLREARHILIEDGYAIFLKYTVKSSQGGRPEWESMTQYADTPHDRGELEELVQEHRPGRYMTLMDDPDNWRRVKIVSAQILYWEGHYTITSEGLLEEPRTGSSKPGPPGKHRSSRNEDGTFSGPKQP